VFCSALGYFFALLRSECGRSDPSTFQAALASNLFGLILDHLFSAASLAIRKAFWLKSSFADFGFFGYFFSRFAISFAMRR